MEKHFIAHLLENEAFKEKNYGKALEDTMLLLDHIMCSDEGIKELAEIYALCPKDEGDDGSPKKKSKDAMTAKNCGTTATVVIITPDEIICSNTGDSRTIMCQGGEAIQLSEDHRPEDKAETERINKAGVKVIG